MFCKIPTLSGFPNVKYANVIAAPTKLIHQNDVGKCVCPVRFRNHTCNPQRRAKHNPPVQPIMVQVEILNEPMANRSACKFMANSLPLPPPAKTEKFALRKTNRHQSVLWFHTFHHATVHQRWNNFTGGDQPRFFQHRSIFGRAVITAFGNGK